MPALRLEQTKSSGSRYAFRCLVLAAAAKTHDQRPVFSVVDRGALSSSPTVFTLYNLECCLLAVNYFRGTVRVLMQRNLCALCEAAPDGPSSAI